MKIKYVCLTILVILVFLFYFSTYGKGEGETRRGNLMKYKTYEEFKKSVGGLPYTASSVRKKNIIENYSKLSLGIDKRQVYAIMGEPDVEETLYPKYANKPITSGLCWTYYIYKSNSWGQNLKNDKEVRIFYRADGKVDWIVPSNIEGLHGLGGPKNEAIFLGTYKLEDKKLNRE